MAMFLKSSPAKLSAAFNDMIYVVDSDNKTNINFKYVCDFYINAVRIARLKNNPNPNFSNYGIFNVNKIAQSYINSDYFTAPTLIALVNPYLKFQIKFSETYELAGAAVANNDVITDTEKFAYNTSFSYLEAPIFLGNPSITSILHSQFISNRLDQISVAEATDYYLTGFTDFPDVATVPYSLSVTTYTGLNQTGTAVTTAHPSAISIANFFILNVGPKGLTNAGIPVTGVNSYKVELIRSAAVVDTVLFNIDLCEPKYELLHFAFLNKLGGFESVYFTKASRKTVEIDRKIMLTQGSKYNPATFKVDTKDSNNVYYEGFKTYGARYTEKLKVNSNWLTDQEYVWLTELLISPVIYLQQTIPASIGVSQTSVYVPVRLTNKEYEIKKKVNNKLSQVELEFDLGYNNYSQLR